MNFIYVRGGHKTNSIIGLWINLVVRRRSLASPGYYFRFYNTERPHQSLGIERHGRFSLSKGAIKHSTRRDQVLHLENA